MNLLTNRGRNLFGMVLSFCGVLVMVGALPQLMKASSNDFWINVGIGIQFLAAFALTVLSWYITKNPVTSPELIEEANRAIGAEQEHEEVWGSLTVKDLNFKELSPWMKRFYALFHFGAVGCWVYAIADMLGYIPSPRALDGTGRILPRWPMVLFEIIVGCTMIFLTQFLRTKIVDKWDERFKELLKEIEDETGNQET